MTPDQITVEFVGGPLDGHLHLFEAGVEALAATVALPINDNVFRLMDGRLRGPAQPSRTVALYELRFDGEWRYAYLGSRLPAELNLEHWLV
jgi:hypothetical protein